MLTQEIQRNDWVSFFDYFSRQYQGWTVTVEVFDSEIGAQMEAHELPLEGITADLKTEGKDLISIIVGDAPEDHMTHTITGPTHVRLEQTEKGEDEALQIESASGTTTLIRFCSSMIP